MSKIQPRTLSGFMELLPARQAQFDRMVEILRKTYSLLGLFTKNAKEYKAWYEAQNAADIPAEIKAIAEERWAARTNRDWAKSDELRAKLAELGYAVKDSKTGYELTRN